MSTFVQQDSVVRRIWGDSDVVLFIFAGSAAEFALNKAVDWLYFTGKLPSDPLGRLFSTVAYAHRIIFADTDTAHKAIDAMGAIHGAVEQNRGAKIPDWAYRDVLYMLIDYSIAAYEVLERKLTGDEKEEVYNVFYRMGSRMGLKELPPTYETWLPDRHTHMREDLVYNQYTPHLFLQYKKHLGVVRYNILLQVQATLAHGQVARLLKFRPNVFFKKLLHAYSKARHTSVLRGIRVLLLPLNYKDQINALNRM